MMNGSSVVNGHREPESSLVHDDEPELLENMSEYDEDEWVLDGPPLMVPSAANFADLDSRLAIFANTLNLPADWLRTIALGRDNLPATQEPMSPVSSDHSSSLLIRTSTGTQSEPPPEPSPEIESDGEGVHDVNNRPHVAVDDAHEIVNHQDENPALGELQDEMSTPSTPSEFDSDDSSPSDFTHAEANSDSDFCGDFTPAQKKSKLE